MRRNSLLIVLAFVVSLVVGTSVAQAVVVNDAGTTAGVALVPSAHADLTGYLNTVGLSPVAGGTPCSDPWLAPDLSYGAGPSPLCWQGGAVMHANETFALTWDEHRLSWPTTINYLEQFLRDVGDGSGTLTSPFADSTQYKDGAGPTDRAGNRSIYGGGCIDLGVQGGAACKFGNTSATGPGHNSPAPGCPLTGGSLYCLTDTQIQQSELKPMIAQMGLGGRMAPGYSPLIVVFVPADVEVCLDSAGNLCSVNSAATAQFCSYHSHVNVPGVGDVAYVVQPWTRDTNCDEPKIPALPDGPTPAQLQTDAGVRIVNPLSQALIAAMTNPFLNGWYASDGSEIDDNGACVPEGVPYDQVSVGHSAQNPYYLQREFNNGAAIANNPNTWFGCAITVMLSPTFVAPSSVNPGDVLQLDGSTTASTLIIPRSNYFWDFGDGTTALGPSVTHSYAKSGTYGVKLTVVDRGGNAASFSQTVVVLGTNPRCTGSGCSPGSAGFSASLQLMPQGLRSVLHNGILVRVNSNQAANAIVSISISRAAARRAHIKLGRGPSVLIGRGTATGIKKGLVTLHLRLSKSAAKRLGHLKHVTLTVRLALYARGGAHKAIDAAGHY